MTGSNAKYVSLFSGAGGLDLGLEMSGWQTVYASDNDRQAIETLQANVGRDLGLSRRAFDGTMIDCADVRSLTGKLILEHSGLQKGAVPLLAGGPPCQSWSSAGHQLGFGDPRGQLLFDFVRLANELDVRWLLLENVRGLLTARGPEGVPGSALTNVRRDLLEAGFQTTVTLLNAADFGVPQRRVRLFMLGYRAGDPPPFPLPTHAKSGWLDGTSAWVALTHALKSVGDLEPHEIIRPTGKMAEELACVMPGAGLKSAGKAERTRPSGHWGYKQGAFVADVMQPARTVTASPQQDWIRDEVRGLRRLCPRECAAIQSFPASWTFQGTAQTQYRLIGNAVPPLLAKAIGESILPAMIAPDSETESRSHFEELLPLPARLDYHVQYTNREEASNGASRRAAPNRRAVHSKFKTLSTGKA